MGRIFLDISSIWNKLKEVSSKMKIASIPKELKDQFTQQQLKHNLTIIKYTTIFTIIIASSIHIVAAILQGRFIYLNIFSYVYIFICILFLLLCRYFSKKNKHSILWVIGYFFVISIYVTFGINMIFVSSNIVLYLFSITLFLNMFIPDFKPKAFMPMATLFFILTACLLASQYSFIKAFIDILSMFFVYSAISIIKLSYYNNKLKLFIKMTELKSANEKLEALSTIDELTKINNRRAFMNYMNIIWKQGHRLQLPITVLVIDIDYFKKYNDSLGHLEGDKALIAVAQHMKNKVKRETDFVARFGGEEFVCLLPYVEKTDAKSFAIELVKSVEDMKISHPMSEHSKYLTISAGMASIIPDDNNSSARLLEDADKALYIAKQSGRNRVIQNIE